MNIVETRTATLDSDDIKEAIAAFLRVREEWNVTVDDVVLDQGDMSATVTETTKAT